MMMSVVAGGIDRLHRYLNIDNQLISVKSNLLAPLSTLLYWKPARQSSCETRLRSVFRPLLRFLADSRLAPDALVGPDGMRRFRTVKALLRRSMNFLSAISLLDHWLRDSWESTWSTPSAPIRFPSTLRSMFF